MSGRVGGPAGVVFAARPGVPARRALGALLAAFAALTAFLAPASFAAHSPATTAASTTVGAAGSAVMTSGDLSSPAPCAASADAPATAPTARRVRFNAAAAGAEHTDPWSPSLGRAPPEFRRS